MDHSTTKVALAAAAVAVATTAVAVAVVVRRRKPVFITKDNIAKFMGQVDAVVSDCDGVIWTPKKSHIPNAREGLESLRAAGKKVLFVTNNSVIPPFAKFQKFGFAVTEEEVVHPAMALTRHLKNLGFTKKAMVLGVEQFKDVLREGGIQVIPGRKIGESVETFIGLLDRIKLDPDVGAVVIDLDLNINYVDMTLALNHLRRPDCLFFAGATDASVTFEDGKMIFGPGAFLNALEEASGRTAIRVGKPGSMMIDEFLKDVHKLDLKRTVFVGDSLVQDMGVANACGMKKLLVLSGVTQMKDLDTCDPKLVPDFIIDSVGDFAKLLSKQERPHDKDGNNSSTNNNNKHNSETL